MTWKARVVVFNYVHKFVGKSRTMCLCFGTWVRFSFSWTKYGRVIPWHWTPRLGYKSFLALSLELLRRNHSLGSECQSLDSCHVLRTRNPQRRANQPVAWMSHLQPQASIHSAACSPANECEFMKPPPPQARTAYWASLEHWTTETG